MILGKRRVNPKPKADDIGLGYLLQLLRTYQDISAGNKRVQPLWRSVQNLLVQRQLQLEQVLGDALPASPAEDGYWRQDLSAWRVRWQSATLSSGMKEYSLLPGKPSAEILASLVRFPTFAKQPTGASARTEFVAYGVVRAKEVFAFQSLEFVEGSNKFGRQGKEGLHNIIFGI